MISSSAESATSLPGLQPDRAGLRKRFELSGHDTAFGLAVEVLEIHSPDLPKRLHFFGQRGSGRQRQPYAMQAEFLQHAVEDGKSCQTVKQPEPERPGAAPTTPPIGLADPH